MAEIDVENLLKQLREMKDDELRKLGRDSFELMGIAGDKAKQNSMEIQLEERGRVKTQGQTAEEC